MNHQDDKYDGITECDNPMPDWWLWTFLLTIIFAVIYFIHYEIAGGPTLKQELASAMQEIEAQKKSHTPQLLETEETLSEQMRDPSLISIGAAAFNAKCAACHGNELQGQIGPNLVDKFWLHGKATRADIVKIIRQGVPDKGMPAWEQIVPKTEVYALAAYIISKKETQPANAKSPQGEAVE